MPRHLVLIPVFAWGHLRPESNLAATFARAFPDVIISVIVDADFVEQAKDEILRNLEGSEKDSIFGRIRLIAAGRAFASLTPEILPILSTLDPRQYPIISPAIAQRIDFILNSMMEGKAFQDDCDITWEPAAVKPAMVIADVFLGRLVAPFKNKYHVPLYVYYIGSAASFTRIYAPTAQGGRAEGYVEDCAAIAADEKRSRGRSFAEISKAMYEYSGKYAEDLVKVKGLQPFYEWEDVPQQGWMPGHYDCIASGDLLVKASDGLLLPTVLALEAEGVQGVIDWYCADTPRNVLCVGPQLPPAYFSTSLDKAGILPHLSDNEVQFSHVAENGIKDNSDPSIAFLDEAYKKYGAHSAIYISFGTMFAPQSAHVRMLIDCLFSLEKPIPFLFANASLLLKLPDDLVQKITASDRGLVVPWAPQQAVLTHPATGWIVSHCGAGGTFEALSKGVPVIAWPVTADQPQHALWMSEGLDTSFELLQVRAGPVQGKAYRGGPGGTEIVGTEEAIKKEMMDVLRTSRGEEGERKRENARKVRQIIVEARKPGGQVEQHLEMFGKSFK